MGKQSAVLLALQKVPLFTDLSPSQLKQLLGICQQETHEPGTALCRAGGESDRMFVLLSGTVEIRTARDVYLVSESAITTVGEAGMLTGEPRSATVVAETALSVLGINRRPFFQLMQEDSSLATRLYRNVMRILRQKLIASNQRIGELLQSQAASEPSE
jgi:putative ABC transport system ATP-binding protein